MPNLSTNKIALQELRSVYTKLHEDLILEGDIFPSNTGCIKNLKYCEAIQAEYVIPLIWD